MDLIARLRAADPVPDDEVAGLSTSARARALRAELTMQHQTHTTSRPAPRWQRPLLAGAVVMLGLAGTAVALGIAGDGGRTPEDVVADGARVDPEAVDGELPTDTPPGDAPLGDDVLVDPPISGGGMAMCAVMYTPETLVEREVAFSGTVTAIEGDDVTFSVEEAFKGDLGDTVTLGGAEFLSTPNPDNVNPIEVGGRYLVAGEGGFAWGCGFTHLYDEDVAATWRDAFAG